MDLFSPIFCRRRRLGQPEANRFHAFRRFQNTYLRKCTACPEGVYKFWMGHAEKDMSDLQDKIKANVPFRIQKAKEVGIGFELPSIAPSAPNFGAD